MITLLPFSFIIATSDRMPVLGRTLQSLASQRHQPAELIIIDASADDSTCDFLKIPIPALCSNLLYKKAGKKGAAHQRNEGVELASHNLVGFMDDDILFEENCIFNLWNAISSKLNVGGVNAMITNQKFVTPSKMTLLFYRLMDKGKMGQPGGRLFGPLINTLPSDASHLSESVQVEWLNTTCTLYRRLNLPNPVFDNHFQGYSLMEDLALSLRVGKNSMLLNVRTARIFHDTQPGIEKDDLGKMAEMELVNRFYIMRNIAGMNGFKSYSKLFFQQLYFAIISRNIFRIKFLKGKYLGIRKILKMK
jgi:glycosyltransferase involved in cell wall biosynthesis